MIPHGTGGLPPELAAYARPEPDLGRRVAGALLYGLALAAGLVLNIAFFTLEIFGGAVTPERMTEAMGFGAVPAFVMLLLYLPVPAVLDRFDPEPWWCLTLAFLWGAVVATGAAGAINSAFNASFAAAHGDEAAKLATTVLCAPVTEELMKGLVVWGFFFFLKREFDGVVDGIIYAVFCALGFAAVENVSYYARAALEGDDVFKATFFLRGIVAPWGHPLYTSMTGLGFGIARETNKTWLKWLAPLGGYMFAAFLHSVWNTAATLSNALVVLMLPLWFLFVLAFFILVIWLVKRKGKIIRDHLKDEVLMGNMTPWELDLVTSPVGRIRATFSYGGGAGRRFIDAAARLALSKWHTGRATQGRKMTISADMIFPLRQDLHRLRGEVSRALGRPVQQPQPWTPGAPSPFQPQGGAAPQVPHQGYGQPPQQWRG